MQDHKELRHAFSALASFRLSKEEKLRRIELLLNNTPQPMWEDIFVVLHETKELHLDLLTVEDTIVLLVKFKDFKGLHQLKQRIYLLAKNLPFLLKRFRWRRFPLGAVTKGNRVIRRSLINPLPEELYSSLGDLVRRKSIRIDEVNETETVKRGENYAEGLCKVNKKLEPYPNIRKFIFGEFLDIVTLENSKAEREVRKLEQESRPLYMRFGQHTLPTEVLARIPTVNAEVLEQAFKISECCARSEEEGKPLRMGFIIGDHAKITQVLDTPSVERISDDLFLKEDEWVRLRKEISRKADGVNSTLVVNGEDGHVLDVRALGILTYPEITSMIDSVAFQIFNNCVRIICGGQLQYQHILNRKTGQWNLRNVQQIEKRTESMATRKKINPMFLSRIVKIAFKLSESSEASLYVIGSLAELERHLTTESRNRLHNSRPRYILNISDDELMIYSREDGAIIIDENGMVETAAAYFTYGGGRHEVARQVTRDCPSAISFVISRDATISIYDEGQLVEEIP